MKRLFALLIALFALVLAAPAQAGGGGKSGDHAAPILVLEPLKRDGQADSTLIPVLVGTVWAEGDRRIWFSKDGDGLIAHVVDQRGLVDPTAHLSRFAQKAMTSANEEGNDPDAGERVTRSDAVELAYSGLFAGPVLLLDVKDGAVLQSTAGKFSILAFATTNPDSTVVITKTPNGASLGKYFPERPGLWARLQRWIAAHLPWISPPLLDYVRGPTTWFDRAEVHDDAFTWPIDLVLREGGQRGWKFFNLLGKSAWRADKGLILQPTGLAVPAGLDDSRAIAALTAALNQTPEPQAAAAEATL